MSYTREECVEMLKYVKEECTNRKECKGCPMKGGTYDLCINEALNHEEIFPDDWELERLEE